MLVRAFSLNCKEGAIFYVLFVTTMRLKNKLKDLFFDGQIAHNAGKQHSNNKCFKACPVFYVNINRMTASLWGYLVSPSYKVIFRLCLYSLILYELALPKIPLCLNHCHNFSVAMCFTGY